jgi:hypothetical protein
MDTDDDLDFCSIFNNDSNNTTTSDGIARSNADIDEAEAKIRLLNENELVTAASVQMCGYLQCLLAMRRIVSTFRIRKRNVNVKWKGRCNVHRDQASIISFIIVVCRGSHII